MGHRQYYPAISSCLSEAYSALIKECRSLGLKCALRVVALVSNYFQCFKKLKSPIGIYFLPPYVGSSSAFFSLIKEAAANKNHFACCGEKRRSAFFVLKWFCLNSLHSLFSGTWIMLHFLPVFLGIFELWVSEVGIPGQQNTANVLVDSTRRDSITFLNLDKIASLQTSEGVVSSCS